MLTHYLAAAVFGHPPPLIHGRRIKRRSAHQERKSAAHTERRARDETASGNTPTVTSVKAGKPAIKPAPKKPGGGRGGKSGGR